MTIYTDHRKIYERYNGPLKKGLEIHHIDGNPKNNDISNLKAVTLLEHYYIHFSQGDWGACFLISKRIKNGLTPDQISEIASLSNKQRLANGTHNFLKHNVSTTTLEKQQISRRKNIINGYHNFIGGEVQKKTQQRLIDEGTHHFLGGDLQRTMLEDGRHASCHMKVCIYCKKESNIGNITRWHDQNCKHKPM